MYNGSPKKTHQYVTYSGGFAPIAAVQISCSDSTATSSIICSYIQVEREAGRVRRRRLGFIKLKRKGRVARASSSQNTLQREIAREGCGLLFGF